MMPVAVHQPRGLNGRVTLDIAVNIQAKRQHRAAFLKREQQAVARFLPEDFAITAQVHRPTPRRQRNGVKSGHAEIIHPDGVRAAQVQRVAMDAALTGHLTVRDSVITLVPADIRHDCRGRPFVKSPVRQ